MSIKNRNIPGKKGIINVRNARRARAERLAPTDPARDNYAVNLQYKRNKCAAARVSQTCNRKRAT